MDPRILKLTRAVFALFFLFIGSYLLWAALEGRLSLPELAAGAAGELALGGFVLFCWPWPERRTLSHGMLAVVWGAAGAGAWLAGQDSLLTTVCGFVALTYAASCAWRAGHKAESSEWQGAGETLSAAGVPER